LIKLFALVTPIKWMKHMKSVRLVHKQFDVLRQSIFWKLFIIFETR